MSNEWYEARQEAGDELLRERASELEECGDCESCDKIDKADIYQEVLDKIDVMIDRLIGKRDVHSNIPMILSIQSQIDVLLELKELLQ